MDPHLQWFLREDKLWNEGWRQKEDLFFPNVLFYYMNFSNASTYCVSRTKPDLKVPHTSPWWGGYESSKTLMRLLKIEHRAEWTEAASWAGALVGILSREVRQPRLGSCLCPMRVHSPEHLSPQSSHDRTCQTELRGGRKKLNVQYVSAGLGTRRAFN